MTDRAKALARTLVLRMRQLEEALLDEPVFDGAEETKRHQELVAKVLLSEAGVTDFATTRLVAAAMPAVSPLGDEVPARELAYLAAFIDEHVIFEL
jgi:hypothetical protein